MKTELSLMKFKTVFVIFCSTKFIWPQKRTSTTVGAQARWRHCENHLILHENEIESNPIFSTTEKFISFPLLRQNCELHEKCDTSKTRQKLV